MASKEFYVIFIPIAILWELFICQQFFIKNACYFNHFSAGYVLEGRLKGEKV